MQVLKPEFDVHWANPRPDADHGGGGLTLQVTADLGNQQCCELFAVVAHTADESLWLEFYPGPERVIRIPYEAAMKVLEKAPSGVFSSAEYARREARGEYGE